eukprot:353449-Chlamydomonas_euryale.AAC.1
MLSYGRSMQSGSGAQILPTHTLHWPVLVCPTLAAHLAAWGWQSCLQPRRGTLPPAASQRYIAAGPAGRTAAGELIELVAASQQGPHGAQQPANISSWSRKAQLYVLLRTSSAPLRSTTLHCAALRSTAFCST